MNVRPRAVSNSAGFFVNDTCRMLLIATPASSSPAFRPLRGSSPLGYVCAESLGATTSASSTAVVHSVRTFPIRFGSGSGDSKDFQHLSHQLDLRRLHREHVVRKNGDVDFLSGHGRGKE